ncbi:MAG: DNA repair protein RecN, partial [Clostridia bacterium]|nr:DNA repair protein RecN [Clostridia bacterium]
LIRHGEAEMSVEAVFCGESNGITELLEANGLEQDDTVVLRRALREDGKGECRINGKLVALSMLREIAGSLIDVYGQSEHVGLLKPQNHIKLLDAYAGECLVGFKNKLSECTRQWRELKAKLASLGEDEAERARRIDLYRYQIEEITEAHLQEGEEEALIKERTLLMHAEKLKRSFSEIGELLSGEDGAIASVTEAAVSFSQTEGICEEAQGVSERLRNVRYELEDIADIAEGLLSKLDFDERRADRVEDRIQEYKRLKKKYGASSQEILQYLSGISEDLYRLENADEQLQLLQKQKSALAKKGFALAKDLSDARKKSAEQLGKAITSELSALNMPSAQFVVQFSDFPDEESILDKLCENGVDEVCFLLSANKGEPLKPLHKVVSGGEMSRFMLAIKTITADVEGIDTLVFDEIDAGISGVTANIVAQKMASISLNRQVICISHSPAIAAMADANYLIEKIEGDKETVSDVRRLDEQGKREEVARLSGASVFNENSAAHADGLITNACIYKKEIASKV